MWVDEQIAESIHGQDNSDVPSWTGLVDGQGQVRILQRDVPGIDGDLVMTWDYGPSSATVAIQMTNLHGDAIAIASLNPNAAAPVDRFETDEFGNPRQPTNRRHGWLGAKQRRTELPSGVIQMGVRSYVPALGRFTSVDPVFG